jgi:hypothetical protein
MLTRCSLLHSCTLRVRKHLYLNTCPLVLSKAMELSTVSWWQVRTCSITISLSLPSHSRFPSYRVSLVFFFVSDHVYGMYTSDSTLLLPHPHRRRWLHCMLKQLQHTRQLHPEVKITHVAFYASLNLREKHKLMMSVNKLLQRILRIFYTFLIIYSVLKPQSIGYIFFSSPKI